MDFKTRANFELSVSNQCLTSASPLPASQSYFYAVFYFCRYDPNFFYNALSFLRSTSRSFENHVFIVLKKHFLYLVVVKFPRSFLLAIRTFPMFSEQG